MTDINRTGDIPDDPDEFIGRMAPMFLYILLSVVLSLGMIVYYIIDITRNPKFQSGDNSKVIWILVVIFGSTIGMIAYFIAEIYPRKILPPLPRDEEMI